VLVCPDNLSDHNLIWRGWHCRELCGYFCAFEVRTLEQVQTILSFIKKNCRPEIKNCLSNILLTLNACDRYKTLDFNRGVYKPFKPCPVCTSCLLYLMGSGTILSLHIQKFWCRYSQFFTTLSIGKNFEYLLPQHNPKKPQNNSGRVGIIIDKNHRHHHRHQYHRHQPQQPMGPLQNNSTQPQYNFKTTQLRLNMCTNW
jgi:hypothetical protein